MPPRPLLRVANAVVAAILRSPAHRLLSGSLMLLTVRGRRTGRAYTFPVHYERSGDILAVTLNWPERKTWWRNLVEPAPVTALVAGRELAGVGELAGDFVRIRLGTG